VADDVEAKARAIVDKAKQARSRPTRGLWIGALVVSAICVVALVIGYLTHGPAEARGPRPEAPSSGFGTGLLIGLVLGIALGSAIALRKRDRD
jgi:hypothetical protein